MACWRGVDSEPVAAVGTVLAKTSMPSCSTLAMRSSNGALRAGLGRTGPSIIAAVNLAGCVAASEVATTPPILCPTITTFSWMFKASSTAMASSAKVLMLCGPWEREERPLEMVS